MNVGAYRVVLSGLARLCGAVAPAGGAAGRRLLYCGRGFTILALSAVLLSVSASAAQAEAPKLISYGAFHADVSGAAGVAVDQSTGDVYVTGLFNIETFGGSQIDKFNASGKLISPSPFGGAIYSGAAVNPTNGDLDVIGEAELLGPASVYTFSPITGALLSSFSVPNTYNFDSPDFTAVQIATDSAGDVYVPDPFTAKEKNPAGSGEFEYVPNDEVHEYSPSGTSLATFTDKGTLKESGGVAVDSSGDLWVADTGNNRIVELSSSGAPVEVGGKPVEIKSEGVQDLALGLHGEVFALVDNGADFCGSLASPCVHLVEYSPTGAQIADIGAGSFEQMFPVMLAANDSNGRVYVTDGAKNVVGVYGPPIAPSVEKEFTAEVSASEVKLGAVVNPGGLETSFRFEYLSEAAFQANGESFSGPNQPTSAPFPEGNVGQGVVSRTVWASANGLQPGAAYHFRVVAENVLGETVGADQTFTTATLTQVSCPNEELRTGFSASLPDCRAYELVTPSNELSAQPDATKITVGGFDNGGGTNDNFAAADGNRMSFISGEPLPGSTSAGWEYLSTRGAVGWSTESVLPLLSYYSNTCTAYKGDASVSAYSPDMSTAIIFVGAKETGQSTSEEGGGCGAEGVEVVHGEPLGLENLLLRTNGDGAYYQLINVPPQSATPGNAKFAGASRDLSHVLFTENARLTANAPAGVPDLFEWSAGAGVRLVTVLPDGSPVVGAVAAGSYEHSRVISADGSRVFFTASDGLYVRIDGERTVQLDEAQGIAGPGGGGSFQEASSDGTRVFFTDEGKLTADSTAASGEPDVYECELPEGATKCKLTDLTVGEAGEHASARRVVGASEDGSYVYFVAHGVLSGAQTNEHGEAAQSGQANLYVSHDGVNTFVATVVEEGLIASGLASSSKEGVRNSTRVSPDGLFFAFATKKSLTGYDNTDAVTGEADPEIFLYEAASHSLACASCNPSGEPPVMGPGPGERPQEFGEATGGATMELDEAGSPHFLSDSGQVFFETREALVPRDTNGQLDVYEYEAGRLDLISAGTGSSRSIFLDASEDGSNVFFLSSQQLVAQDTNAEALNIYDARVDGGFPEVASPPPCTTADACRAPVSPQPSIYGSPSSQTFSGAGNVIPPSAVKPKAKPKSRRLTCKKGSPKKRDKSKKRAKCLKQSKRNAEKSAHANRTGK